MKPGDKVVCVNDIASRCGCEQLIKKGSVYVVNETLINPRGVFMLRLVGIKSQHYCRERNSPGGGFDAGRFRKLDELKQQSRKRQQTKQTNFVERAS